MQWNFASNIYCGNKGEDGRSYCHPDNFKPISNLLFRNNGDGTFTDATLSSKIGESPGKSLGLAFADFNNDGLIDINVANDSYQQFLFKNLGKGVFQEMGVIAGTGYTEDGKSFAGMGTDFADIDDDGFPDIVTTALSNESYAYFHNNGTRVSPTPLWSQVWASSRDCWPGGECGFSTMTMMAPRICFWRTAM
jgi:hypothetical protein